MASEVTLGNRIAAGINAFRQAGGGQRSQPSASASVESPAQPPAERRTKAPAVTLNGIPGQDTTIPPRGTYLNILV